MRRLVIASLAGLSACIAASAETSFPARPITLVVPVSAGGPTDAIARILADRMGATLGQRVLVENVTGAAGNIGIGRVARAAPDGYTIGIGLTSTHVFNGAIYKLPFDLVKDFEPIALVATNPQMIVARMDFPARDLRELVAWLKSNPGKATMATIGPGSPAHIAGVEFEKLTGTELRFVPYRGGAPGMQDLLAGQIDLMIPQPSLALQHIRSGAIRAYAVMSDKRIPSAPEIPTVDEAGVPGLHIAIWHGFWAPRGTPADVIAKLNAATMQALSDPGVRERFAQMGQEIPEAERQKPAALREYQEQEIKKWWSVIQAANIHAD
jgi:tripartite-type tricarboxylate transporter receptor subunit TctC